MMEMQQINMDELSIEEQIRILLSGEHVNQYHAANSMSIEDFNKLKLMFLRLTTSVYGLMCATHQEDKKITKILAKQTRISLLLIVEMIDEVIVKHKIDMGDASNVH